MVITVKVIFRKDKETGEIFAIFPEEKTSRPYSYLSYSGNKHGSGEMSIGFYHLNTLPMSFDEYKSDWQDLAEIENSWNDNYVIFEPVNRITHSMHNKRIGG